MIRSSSRRWPPFRAGGENLRHERQDPQAGLPGGRPRSTPGPATASGSAAKPAAKSKTSSPKPSSTPRRSATTARPSTASPTDGCATTPAPKNPPASTTRNASRSSRSDFARPLPVRHHEGRGARLGAREPVAWKVVRAMFSDAVRDNLAPTTRSSTCGSETRAAAGETWSSPPPKKWTPSPSRPARCTGNTATGSSATSSSSPPTPACDPASCTACSWDDIDFVGQHHPRPAPVQHQGAEADASEERPDARDLHHAAGRRRAPPDAAPDRRLRVLHPAGQALHRGRQLVLLDARAQLASAGPTGTSTRFAISTGRTSPTTACRPRTSPRRSATPTAASSR
jgi:hypothetical protein